jgi:hypothetical protein
MLTVLDRSYILLPVGFPALCLRTANPSSPPKHVAAGTLICRSRGLSLRGVSPPLGIDLGLIAAPKFAGRRRNNSASSNGALRRYAPGGWLPRSPTGADTSTRNVARSDLFGYASARRRLVQHYGAIYVGNVSSSKLAKRTRQSPGTMLATPSSQDRRTHPLL